MIIKQIGLQKFDLCSVERVAPVALTPEGKPTSIIIYFKSGVSQTYRVKDFPEAETFYVYFGSAQMYDDLMHP